MDVLIIVIAIASFIVSVVQKKNKTAATSAQRTEGAGRPTSPAPRGAETPPHVRPMRPAEGPTAGPAAVRAVSRVKESPRAEMAPRVHQSVSLSEGESEWKDDGEMPGAKAAKASPAAFSQQPAPVELSGLNLTLDGDAMVRGVIYSEILNRRPARQRRRYS